MEKASKGTDDRQSGRGGRGGSRVRGGEGRGSGTSNSTKPNKGMQRREEVVNEDNNNNGKDKKNESKISSSKNKSSKNHRKGRGKQKASNSKVESRYPPHWSYEKCMKLYVEKDSIIVRGKLRVLPAKDGMAFVACDRGSMKRDVVMESSLERNRGMNGDIVFVELLPLTGEQEDEEANRVQQGLSALDIHKEKQGDEKMDDAETELWQDDAKQMALWNPVIPIRRIKELAQSSDSGKDQNMTPQRRGRIVHVCAPPIPSDAPQGTRKPRRIMVGTLKALQSGICLFTPNDRVLPQFKCDTNLLNNTQKNGGSNKSKTKESSDLYRAEYIYGSWKALHSWPPCTNVKRLGDACSIEDQIQGLLMENQVDHGDFSADVLNDVEEAVKSGIYLMTSVEDAKSDEKEAELGWKPTPEMYKGRRDYRSQRIFTIGKSKERGYL